MTLQHSPLDAEHRALGATMVEFGGWAMPIACPSGTIEEHLTCRRRAVMFDVSHLGTVRVEGPDAFELLQRTLTNDLGLPTLSLVAKAIQAARRAGDPWRYTVKLSDNIEKAMGPVEEVVRYRRVFEYDSTYAAECRV